MSGIFNWLKGKRDPREAAAAALCDAVIAKAREPWAYAQGLAEDTFEGRFAMTALYGGLVMRRLRMAGPEGLSLSERLGEALFDRFDYALREEGVGDATIARKARKLGEAFFGLARALDGALSGEAASVEGVAPVLRRNGLGGAAPERLAEVVLGVVSALDQCDDTALLSGAVDWTG